MRQTVLYPVLEVPGVLFCVPPTGDLPSLVLHLATEVGDAGLDLRGNQDRAIEAPFIAHLQEHVNAKVMAGVLRRTPVEVGKVRHHAGHPGAAGLFRLACSHELRPP